MTEQRNHRTGLFVKECKVDDPEKLFSKTILITGEEKLLATENGKTMIKTLVNLTCRFVNSLHIALPKSHISLQKELTNLSSEADTHTSNEVPSQIDVVITIGNTSLKGEFNINLNSNGWVSYLSCNNNVSVFDNPMQNPIGAMGAACFGAAEAFKRLLEISGCEEKWVYKHLRNFTFSFLTYSFTEDNFSFPTSIMIDEQIILVGVGAVGSGFVYALSNIPQLTASIDAIESDNFDEPSLNRCLICFKNELGENKAKVAEKYSNESLQIKSQPMKFNKFVDKMGAVPPFIISTVDNNEARYQIQYNLPKLIFHGSTGKSIANVSVIKLLENACFCCIYEPNSSYEEIISNEMGIPLDDVKNALKHKEKFSHHHFALMKEKLGSKADKFQKFIGMPFEEVYKKEVCGKIQVKTKEGVKTSSVSFVSFFSGLSLAAELIKFFSKEFPFPMKTTKDFLRLNLFLPETMMIARRVKNPNCSFNCSSTIIKSIYSKKWNIMSITDSETA